MLNIKKQLAATLKEIPPEDKLGFGLHFTDHMFVAKYSSTNGWYESNIVPYGPISLLPAASVLHYGQSIFEGMKAFRHKSGRIVLFRPEMNYQRFLQGAEAVCLVPPPQELFHQAIKELINVDKRWVPYGEDSALYIRPFLFGSESFLGVRAAKEYMFMVILSPSGSYYAEGNKPVKIWIEDHYVRATSGGLGNVKAGANYAASLRATVNAKQKGFSQVLWLDSQHDAIEEVGTMNVFFVFNDEICTPKLSGTILSGVTRDSVIKILQSKGHKISERKITIKELIEKIESGQLREAFGTGTAAVISPIGSFSYKSKEFLINGGEIGSLSAQIKKDVLDVQKGRTDDVHRWLDFVD